MNRILPRFAPSAALLGALLAASATAQTHKVAKTEDVVRAVGVYEWTGDMKKPTASRLIPVSLFINSKLEDAAIYEARPVPFALVSGNVYELDQAGVSQGLLSLEMSRHLHAAEDASTTFDDGWFGYGNYVAPPAPPKAATLRASRTTPVITSSKSDDSRPHFGSKAGSDTSTETASTPSIDAPIKEDTPAASTPAGDPDRPTMHRRADADDTSASSKSGSGASKSSDPPDTPSDDPDRPTLRRRPTEDPKKPAKSGHDESGVTGPAVSLNDDPNRPTLKHGKPTNLAAQVEAAQLVGVPEDLRQMVAVSDPVNRPVHNFARPWDDEAQHADILAKMQAAARAELAAYAAASITAPKIAKPAATTHTANSKLRRPAGPSPEAPPTPLVDEQLKGYLLSYGGAPTYVYSAHTAGEGAALRYVTLVAQVDMQSNAQVALKSVTDVTHLDRTPRMRLVDAVDAEASNRASLLFELRGENSRQFALYRVIGARAEQTFATGTTQ